MRSRSSRRHPVAAFLAIAVGLLATGGIYAVATAAPAAQAAGSEASPQQIDAGKKLFLEGCSSCHGMNAEGANGNPSLIGVGAASVNFQVGSGRMPLAAAGAQAARSSKVIYSEAEIASLGAWVASLAPGPAVPTEQQLNVSDADLAQGGALFRTNCAQCHNFAGQGGALTNGKYAPSMMQATPKQVWEAMITGPQAMPSFPNTTLTEKDKQAIIKWVGALQTQPQPGGMALGNLGPVTEGLVAWVVGIGLLMAVAVWIGVKAR